YDESNGLQAREFNDKAAYKTRQGEMIFGGPNGFNIFNPDKFSINRKVPSVVLTDLQIFNKEITAGDVINGRAILSRAFPETKEITLKYKENIFSIEFAALGFSQSAKDKFAYKLEGFNKDWVITDGSQRRVSYTNLDPGSYTFRVKAANSDGIWNEEGAVLKINILPPFWRTPLAYFIYTLAIVGALFLARRITLERARMRFQMEQQQKEAERIQALDAMKTKFFTNISHEFRTPLSLILSPLDTIVKNTGEGNQKKQLQLIQRNARRLLNLVNQLLDFRKMEVQEFKLQLSKGDIIRFVKDIVSSFSDISEKKNIELVFSSDAESFETFFDRDKLEKILFNLLSNAFKYTPANGNIHVNISYSAANSSIYLSVKDSGIGIPAEMHEKIFERFFQHTVPDNMLAQGSGIGLAITKEFVKLHNGSIKVDSEPEKGTCFTVTLPVKEINETVADNLTPITETILAREEVSFVEAPEVEFAGPTSKKPIILLVEDNEDFRFYLKDNLKQSYEVVEAVNGKEGWDKIKQLIPDLIVSDIMMPLMNGIELSKKIKSDPRTSHIPVVLLTAMSGEEIQLEGYQAGINDYIVKPFTFEILASRLKNLVAMQRQLRKNFQKQLEVNPGEITVTPVDEQFMKNALAAVEKNMDNPEFTVEELSRELFLSRVALYKKLLSLTGKTPIEFIRVLRMKRGAQLLEKTDKTVAEVAYEVGFNNPKNFAKYFKEEFNILPSQYMAQKRNGSLPDANTANA
ncbi:MAG: response regulator, partial [Chitinophagaceae bacterium]|nr:response regulator [Chitinophagaceae bacterium]